LLTAVTGVVGAGGLAASGWPFLAVWNPSEKARAEGAPVTVDVSALEPGQQITVPWRGRPVWILRRGDNMLDELKAGSSKLRDPYSHVMTQQPEYARNYHRSIRPEYLVAVGLCTHLGCVPTFRPDAAPSDLGPSWRGGYFCPCHGSLFDFSGRVYQGVPAPSNLLVPPHRYLDARTIEIGRHA
jgi:ubiquinol-cytochrome c reductase iron-sulfur subunit